MTPDDLADTRARSLVEGMEPVLMHYWALDALAAGAEAPALRRTAETDVRAASALRAHFDQALDELGAPRLDEVAARWQYARYMARAVIEGELDAITAARRIVWGAADPLRQPEQLRPFIDAIDAIRAADPAANPAADAERIEAICRQAARDYLAS